MASTHGHPDSSERTPLLRGKPQTPIPWGQMNLVMVALLAEPISSLYIIPFINQLIGELGVTGGDDRKIGYYAGLIESLFFLTQAFTSWQWSRLSDFIGRRPIILLGLMGLSFSNLAFGLSRTLGTLMISRCVAGILNGNIGVMKSMLGDITDDTNMARVFTLVPPVFFMGITIASLYGGALAKPQERWPRIFQGNFWATYPYFLPALVSSCYTFLTFFVCVVFMKESLPSKAGKRPHLEEPVVEDSPNNPPRNDGRPVPMMTLLQTYSVMIPIANYCMSSLVEMGFYMLLPLFYSSPIQIGGLGFPPHIIGTFLAIFGVMNGCVQGLFASKIIERVGAKRVFRRAILSFYPLILLFPIMSAVVTAQGKVGPLIWVLLGVQLTLMVLMDLAFVTIFMFVTKATPNKQSLGSVHGLSQSLTSVVRAIAPASVTSLFALSKQYNILGGNLVYVVLMVVTTVLVMLSRRLPDLVREEDSE